MTIERPYPHCADSMDSFSRQPATGQPGSKALTSESPKPAEGIGRRGVLAALALLPAALPVAAEAASDPIFAMIDKCKRAQRHADAECAQVSAVNREARRRFGEGDESHPLRVAYIESVLGCDEDEYTEGPFDDLFDSYGNLVGTVPATLPGLFAMLIYVEEIDARGDAISDEDAHKLFSTLSAAAKALSGRSA